MKQQIVGDIRQRRLEAAEKALLDNEWLDDEYVLSREKWAPDDKNNEYTCLLSVQGVLGLYRCGFIVRFKKESDEVVEAYPGDPH